MDFEKTDQFKFCPDCGKPLPHQDLEDNYRVCVSCGWTNKKKSVTQFKPRFTVPTKKIIPKTVLSEFLMGCILGVILVLVGSFLLIIPIIGWIAGSCLVLMGLALPFAGIITALDHNKRNVKTYSLNGSCPYCNHDLTHIGVDDPDKKEDKSQVIKCDTCKERVSVKNDRFYTIIKQYTES